AADAARGAQAVAADRRRRLGRGRRGDPLDRAPRPPRTDRALVVGSACGRPGACEPPSVAPYRPATARRRAGAARSLPNPSRRAARFVLRHLSPQPTHATARQPFDAIVASAATQIW